MNNLAVVRNFIINVLNVNHFTEIDNYIAPHFQTHSLHLNPKAVNPNNPPNSYKEALIQSQNALSEFTRTIDDIFSDGDRVVVRHTTTAIHKGEFMGIPATNRKIAFWGISIYKLENGKITDEWYIWDRLGLYQQLGKI